MQGEDKLNTPVITVDFFKEVAIKLKQLQEFYIKLPLVKEADLSIDLA